MTDIEELHERLEKLTGPDREIDGLLWAVEEPRILDLLPHFKDDTTVPRFTASIDAAVALAERVLPGWGLAMGTVLGGDDCWAVLRDDTRDHIERGYAERQQLPLAICLAVLRARAQDGSR